MATTIRAFLFSLLFLVPLVAHAKTNVMVLVNPAVSAVADPYTTVIASDTFINDNSTGTINAAYLDNNTSTWTARTGSAIGVDASSRAYATASSAEAYYYLSNTPTDANYKVCATFKVSLSGKTTPAIGLRFSTTVKTGYTFNYAAGDWHIREFVNGSENGTSIGSYSGASPTSETTACIGVTGSEYYADIGGVRRITVTDASVSAAGRAGIADFYAENDSAQYIDNVIIYDDN